MHGLPRFVDVKCITSNEILRNMLPRFPLYKYAAKVLKSVPTHVTNVEE